MVGVYRDTQDKGKRRRHVHPNVLRDWNHLSIALQLRQIMFKTSSKSYLVLQIITQHPCPHKVGRPKKQRRLIYSRTTHTRFPVHTPPWVIFRS